MPWVPDREDSQARLCPRTKATNCACRFYRPDRGTPPCWYMRPRRATYGRSGHSLHQPLRIKIRIRWTVRIAGTLIRILALLLRSANAPGGQKPGRNEPVRSRQPLPETGDQPPADPAPIGRVGRRSGQQALFHQRPADVTAAGQHHNQDIPQRDALQQVPRLNQQIRRIHRMPDDGVGARVTRSRSAATKPKERPSAKSDTMQTARPASCRPSPATTPQCGWAPAGRNSTPANVPPNASSQLPGFRLTAAAGRRTRKAITNHVCSTRKAPR
jgi:hypothetical protein